MHRIVYGLVPHVKYGHWRRESAQVVQDERVGRGGDPQEEGGGGYSAEKVSERGAGT